MKKQWLSTLASFLLMFSAQKVHHMSSGKTTDVPTIKTVQTIDKSKTDYMGLASYPQEQVDAKLNQLYQNV